MRRFFAQRKHALLLLLGAILLCVASQVCVFTGYTNFVRLSQRTTASIAIRTTPSPIATKQQSSHDRQGDHKGLPYTSGKPQTRTTHVPAFEAGVAYPQWTPSGYSKSDARWTQALQDITTQMHASWLEMPLLFYQSSLSATTVTTGVSTPTVASFVEGIQTAHAQGYHVFVTPLLTVSSGSMAWSGSISFSTQWESSSTAPTDPTEQAAACNAALANATHDPHIRGIFFWGWDDVGAFGLRNQPTAAVLHHWYGALT